MDYEFLGEPRMSMDDFWHEERMAEMEFDGEVRVRIERRGRICEYGLYLDSPSYERLVDFLNEHNQVVSLGKGWDYVYSIQDLPDFAGGQ